LLIIYDIKNEYTELEYKILGIEILARELDADD